MIKIIANIINNLFLKDMPRIVIASPGRAASTMLSVSIVKSMIASKFEGRWNNVFSYVLMKTALNFIDRVQDVNDEYGVVFKTHDLYKNDFPNDIKYIFIYSGAIESVSSVEKMVGLRGMSWFYEHQKHLQGNGEYKNLFELDILNYENQVVAWLGANKKNILCIPYSRLWESVDNISEFLGFPILLPERIKRKNYTLKKNFNIELFQYLDDLVLKLEKEMRKDQ